MAKDTKDRILDSALTLFSQKGYTGTNMRELASAMGLTKAALYKHFRSKEEILDTLMDSIEAYYRENFGSKGNLPPVPDSAGELMALTRRMVDFTVHDERIVKTRKILAIEQFRDEKARTLATRHYITGLQEIFTTIFREMIGKGLLREEDPAMLAFAYAMPISALIQLCDREPARTAEALEKIDEFSAHFIRTYGVNK